MKSSFLPKVGAVALSATVLAWSLPAKALNFGFSFNNGGQSVSGTITNVPNGGGTGTVAVTSSSIGGIGTYTPNPGGTFNVSGGNLTSANYTGTFSGFTLTFSGTTGTLNSITGPVSFSAAGAAAAPWEFNPTVGVLLALLPFGVGYVRNKAKKRKKEGLSHNLPSEGVKA